MSTSRNDCWKPYIRVKNLSPDFNNCTNYISNLDYAHFMKNSTERCKDLLSFGFTDMF